MIIRLESPNGYDVMLGADCIESIWGSVTDAGDPCTQVRLRSGQAVRVTGSPSQLYSLLTTLGYTMHSRSDRALRT